MQSSNKPQPLDIKTLTPALRHTALMLLEYRVGGEKETIKWRDKTTGQMQEAEVQTFSFESATGAVRLSMPREIPNDYPFKDPAALKRGAIYLVEIHALSVNRGVLAATGLVLHPVPE